MMSLDAVVNHRRLQAEAIAHARETFRTDRFGAVVIDDFLQPSLLTGLLACFEGDGNFQEHRSLKQNPADEDACGEDHTLTIERTVSEAQFDATAPERWLARELLMADEPPTNIQTRGWQAHIRFMQMLASDAFKDYLHALTGAVDMRDVTYLARTMRHGDVCAAHSDSGDGRTLCMLLYIGDGWRPGFGGRFQNVVDGEVGRSTDPLCNRLILHRPAPDQIHQVEPISEAGRQWRRHSYSVWFGTFPDL